MKAPNFKLSSTSGKTVELNKIKSNFIIIYFYPKDNTSGCTIETNDFNKLLSKFEKLGCTIYGISKDSIESHKKRIKKQNYKRMEKCKSCWSCSRGFRIYKKLLV